MKLKGVAPCSIVGCHRLYYGRGWCHTHYMRWRRSGDPLGSTLAHPDTRFDRLLSPDSHGCHLWTGAICGGTGYGNFWLRGATVLAHRYSYERGGRLIPSHLELDHLCRVRRCVNPAHLEAVTRGENVRRQLENAGQFRPASTRERGDR